MRDKTLLQALILGLGQVTAKVLSLIFLFKFSNDLGKETMALYVYAYVPFSIFADLSCFGLIPGTSKLVSKLRAEEEEEKINFLLKRGTLYSLLAGVGFFLFMLFFSRQILSVSLFDEYDQTTFEGVRINLFFASLSLIFIPSLHFFRGFLQGNLIMYPSSLSLIVENVLKVFLYIVLAGNIQNINTIHLVFFIYFFSYFISLLILFWFIFPYFKKKKLKFNAIFSLLKTSIPFGIATMFFTIYQFIDSITLSILLPVEGYYTAYMFETIRLIFLPIVIAQALGGALNPKMNYMFKEHKVESARRLAVRCSTLIIYILIPLTVLMKYFASDIYNLFYKQENGAMILYHISDLIVFFGLYKVLIGISLGLPSSHYIIIATILSAVAKYTLNYLLIPHFGYLGAIYATILAISICILVAYFVLFKEKMNLFWQNVKAVLLAFGACFFSLLFVVIFRVGFYLGSYPVYYSIILYSILLMGVYCLLLKIVKHTTAYLHIIN